MQREGPGPLLQHSQWYLIFCNGKRAIENVVYRLARLYIEQASCFDSLEYAPGICVERYNSEACGQLRWRQSILKYKYKKSFQIYLRIHEAIANVNR
jgi:hypothetical protein